MLWLKFDFLPKTFSLGVIHKPRGQNFGYFDPLPPSWSLLLNKAYVMNGHLANPPPPKLSTWFMDDPFGGVNFEFPR